MRKTVDFQKWTFPFLTLLIVVVAAFSGEVFSTTASPSLSSVPTSCTLKNGTNGNRRLDVPNSSAISDQVRTDLLGSSSSSHISTLFSLQCKNGGSSSHNSSQQTQAIKIGPLTNADKVQPTFNRNAGSSCTPLDTLTFVRGGSGSPSYHALTVSHPSSNCDTVTWDFTQLTDVTPPSQTCTFVIHVFDNDLSSLGFSYNGGGSASIVQQSTSNDLQILTGKQNIKTIGLVLTGVQQNTVVKIGDFFVGNCN